MPRHFKRQTTGFGLLIMSFEFHKQLLRGLFVISPLQPSIPSSIRNYPNISPRIPYLSLGEFSLKMERIDVHAHCVPPAYREYCLQNDFAGRGHPDGMPAIPVGRS